ncbi:hypothetical protein [Paenibacillus sp. L3-i20]|uniref:hypothetical protein n=1 Tax=Paenibacillus sp. L3-i20 TaxID=2905833 RepID=UPI0020C039F9|nr:hypothetical protein [Paenibacillus sp. L3-i20]
MNVNLDTIATTINYVEPTDFRLTATSLSATTIIPSDRDDAMKQWYMEVSPYKMKVATKVEYTGVWYRPILFTNKKDMYHGMDVELFTSWEIESNRISDTRYNIGTINYWEWVNAGFTYDTQRAKTLADNNQTSNQINIQRLIDYRKTGKVYLKKYGRLSLGQLANPFDNVTAAKFYSHVRTMSASFWKSHNTSIVYWDDSARRYGYYGSEDPVKQTFIDGVIIRVEFTSDLPFSIPTFGNNVPPVGLIGVFLNSGPFKYPTVYPAPAPSSSTIDYGNGATAEIIRAYMEFLLNEGTNPVFTWWIPGSADDEARAFLQSKGLTIDSPREDWKLQFVDPAAKTIEAIKKKYLE